MNPKLGHKSSLLRKWITGDYRSADERSLKQAAADDPFLADALEGYQNMPDSNHAEHLTRLQKRIRHSGNSKAKPLNWRNLAAAAAVLSALTVGIWYLNTQFQQAKEMAMEMTVSAEESSPKNTSSEIKNELPVATATDSPTNAATANKKISPRSYSVEAEDQINEASTAFNIDLTDANATQIDPNGRPQESLILMNPPQANTAVPPSRMRPTSMPSALDEEAFDAAMEPEVIGQVQYDTQQLMDMASRSQTDFRSYSNMYIGKIISGKVTDKNGDPLVGANVQAVGTATTTLTNYNGEFKVQVSPTVDFLDFSYVGYDSERVLLAQNGNENLSVAMANADKEAPDDADESSYQQSATRKKLDANIPVGVSTPKGGFAKYQKYILQNIRIPEKGKANAVRGIVTVAFTVNRDGSTSDFIILRSLGFGCDEEAIRLIKEGPKWKTKEAERTSLDIEFKDW